MNITFENKVVVITGAAGGLGSAMAKKFAADGASVAVCDRENADKTAGEIREDDCKGRHTTTHRQLLRLENGVLIIDTPGMRELGMWGVDGGLEEAFADVEQYLGRCRFRDCRHDREPGCAIRQAIEDGELDAARWESYQKLKTEAQSAQDKHSLLRQKQQWRMGISKTKKMNKKEIW